MEYKLLTDSIVVNTEYANVPVDNICGYHFMNCNCGSDLNDGSC